MKSSSYLMYFIYFIYFICFFNSLYAFGSWRDDGHVKGRLEYFAGQDRQGVAPSSLLFIGSSTIEMWGEDRLRHHFGAYGSPVVNRGIGGTQFDAILELKQELIYAQNPRAIILYSGDNDLLNETPSAIIEDITNIIKDIRQHPKTASIPLFLISVKPSPSRVAYLEKAKTLNGMMEKLRPQFDNLIYIDVFSIMLTSEGKPREDLFLEDKLHMNDRGYDLWQKIVNGKLQSRLTQN